MVGVQGEVVQNGIVQNGDSRTAKANTWSLSPRRENLLLKRMSRSLTALEVLGLVTAATSPSHTAILARTMGSACHHVSATPWTRPMMVMLP